QSQQGSREPPSQLQSTIAGADFASFKTSVENAVDTEVGRVTAKLAIWRANVSKNRDFGSDILQELEKQFPGRRMNERQTEDEGKRYLDSYYDKLRSGWAKEWAFYRNNPVYSRLAFFPQHIQAEMWALWILGSEWKTKYVTSSGMGNYSKTDAYWV